MGPARAADPVVHWMHHYAADWAGPRGPARGSRGYRLVSSPDLFGEAEVLIEGVIRGAAVLR